MPDNQPCDLVSQREIERRISLNFSRLVAPYTLNRELRISDPVLNRTYAQRRSSAMAMVSHLHHLFNPETCQSYIHRLRWKNRPLQCPRCQRHNVGPWGAYQYQPGLQRYRCKEKDCK